MFSRALAALLFAPALALAGTANLTWTAPTKNTDGSTLTTLNGFRVFQRCQSGTATQIAQVPKTQLSYTVSGIPDDGRTCWYSLTAFDTANVESSRTVELSKVFPAPKPGNDTLALTWKKGSPSVINIGQIATRQDEAASVSSSQVTFGTAPANGDTVFVAIAGYADFNADYATTSVTDNKSNSYSRVFAAPTFYPQSGGSKFAGLELWAAYNVTGGGTFTVTVNNDYASYMSWLPFSASGLVLSSAALQANTVNSATGTNTATDASVTAAAANDQADNIVIALATVGISSDADVGWGSAASSGYTNVTKLADWTNVESISVDYKIVSGVTTEAAAWSHDATTGSFNGWTCGIAVFKAAAGSSADTDQVSFRFFNDDGVLAAQ